MRPLEAASGAWATAEEKGWHVRPRSGAEIQVLICSELAEALEAWRESGTNSWDEDGKPCGLASELADVIIRIQDAHKGLCLDYPVAPRKEEFTVDSFFRLLRRANLLSLEGTGASCAWAVEQIAIMCDLDLVEAIKSKMKYNETRTYRHGGKKA